MNRGTRGFIALAATAAALIAGQGAIGSAQAAPTVTIAPTGPGSGNNFPFGQGTWAPHLVWVYKNIPPFDLKAGDTIAFDLQAMNDNDIQVDIALAAATVNGGDQNAAPFTQIVPNTQVPANPKGDTTTGDFELRFTSQASFNFAGGGLLIRISNPGTALAADTTGPNVFSDNLASGSDPSGYFVERDTFDSDGVYPWTGTTAANWIAGFRLDIADVPVPPASTAPAPTPTPAPSRKRKCKKKHHRTLAAKKKCKKKRR
jgi:hypothetical protein